MPAFTRGKKRDQLVFVSVSDLVWFGFKSKDLTSLPGISSSDLTAIGHTLIDTATGFKILGAKSPQPARVKKKLANASVGQQQSVSTFCGHNKLTAASAAGWNLSQNKRSVQLRAANASRGTLTAIATLSDLSGYCFPISKADFDQFGAELGLKSASSITNDLERNRLVFGSSTPYPGRAVKQLAGGSSFSTFFSTNTDVLAAGYEILSEERVLLDSAPF